MKDKNDHIISIFESVFKTIPCGEISVSDFVGGIKYAKWKKETESLRNEKNPEIQKKIKTNLPAVTISGVFTQRKESCLLKHSDFICIDVDDFTDRTRLISDIYTYALFSTVSNTGLAVLVKIDGEKHKESFRWLRNHYFNNYGIVIDSAPQNCASLRTVSYDANCYINEKSKKSKTLSDKPLQINSLPVIIPNDKIGEMVKNTVQRGINLAETYNDYVILAFALASGLGEEGRGYFHSLASVSDKYKQEHADKQYTIALKRPTGKITIGSFYWMLKNAGIEFPQSKKYEAAIRATVLQKKANRSEKSAVNLLKEIYGHEESEAVQIAQEVFKRGDISLSAIAADPEKLIESLVAWVQINHPMKKNLITGKIENSTGELTTEDLNTIYLQARACFNTPNVTYDLFDRIVFSNFTPQYHPIKKYIEENRHRNTIGNINKFINSIETTTPDAQMFIRKWLISIPAAIEGYPVRLVLAFIGEQYNGKTETFRRLLPRGLKKYYGESKLLKGTDDELLMTQKLILMDDEMSGKTKNDEKRFKELTSKDIFSLREPYGHFNQDYKRLAVLCGTSNDREIINDPTGNTRILPVEVIGINYEMYNSIDKDELFMEIVRSYESGEDWNFTVEELKKLNETSRKFEAIPFERELILKLFTTADNAEGYGYVEEMTSTEIKNHIELWTKQQIKSLKRFGMELRKIFGERKVIRRPGGVVNVYCVCKLSPPMEIEVDTKKQFEPAPF